AARISGAGSPPFSSVNYVVSSIATNTGLDVSGVGRGHGGLRPGETGKACAFKQRLQPFLFLFWSSITGENLHVPSVRRRTVKDFGREHAPTHDFAERSVIQVAETCAVLIRQEKIPKSRRMGLLLEFLYER